MSVQSSVAAQVMISGPGAEPRVGCCAQCRVCLSFSLCPYPLHKLPEIAKSASLRVISKLGRRCLHLLDYHPPSETNHAGELCSHRGRRSRSQHLSPAHTKNNHRTLRADERVCGQRIDAKPSTQVTSALFPSCPFWAGTPHKILDVASVKGSECATRTHLPRQPRCS